MRAGIGYDVHRLAAGRRLVLGGVVVPFGKGLEGWSDADVLTHAVMDALLGGAALGDIGTHFPPGDPQYRDISSLTLLAKVTEMLQKNRFHIINLDATVIAEQPQLKEYIGQMRDKLSATLGISRNQVSLKASTSDRLGFTGRGEGIAALAIALVQGGADEGL